MEALALANLFLKKEAMENLKLQKLCYYAQAWYYTVFNEPLIPDNFEAWRYGPVCPKIYRPCKTYGSSAIQVFPEYLEKEKICDDENINMFIEMIFIKYGKLTATELVDLTHSEDPWLEARKDVLPIEISNKIISIESMKTFYSQQPLYRYFCSIKNLSIIGITVIDYNLTSYSVSDNDIIKYVEYNKDKLFIEFYEKLYEDLIKNVKYTFFLTGDNIFVLDESAEDYMNNTSKYIIEGIKSMLEKDNLEIVWEVPKAPDDMYTYTVPEIGIISCAETIDDVIDYAISTIVDTREDYLLNYPNIENKTNKMLLLEKLYELYNDDERAFREFLGLGSSYISQYCQGV